MLQFTTTQLQQPAKRPVGERALDFREIYRPAVAGAAAAQAARCSQCGVPFCQVHCPLQNNIPDWLKLAAEDRLQEAYELAQSTNNMPEICGRICPQDRLCEGNCVIERSGHGTVTIGAIEKYLAETAWDQGWVKPLRPMRLLPQSVGIIGAGPAGLTAAEELRRRGYKVTLYDRHDRAGGLLIYGIPNFKLEKQVVSRRIERLIEGGIHFQLDCEIGHDISFDSLRERHDAVLIATGVYKPRAIEAGGRHLGHIVEALDYLITSNRKGLGDAVPEFDSGRLDAQGKDVAVIGGGDTAMDCVRTAVRQGARSVTCLYRRDRENIPGSLREVFNAEEEGVQFEWLSLPTAMLGAGDVSGLSCVRMRLGPPDAAGRNSVEQIHSSYFTLAAQLVIVAAGFDPEDIPKRFQQNGLAVAEDGRLRIDRRTFMTNLSGVFAAGDVARGASLVVWAIRDGRDVAEAMHRHLGARVPQEQVLEGV
jgi:glutamate synthase (NADPH/NADH) small chain